MTDVTVALLRGINVGGRNSLPMAELRALIAAAGGQDVATYIQSGNAVFRGNVTGAALAEAIETAKGFLPHVLTLPLARYEGVLRANPFSAAAEADGKAVHVYFLDGTPRGLSPEIMNLATATEAVEVKDGAAWLLAPGGIGRSKLAARLEKALGVPATARNWKSAVALRDLAWGLA